MFGSDTMRTSRLGSFSGTPAKSMRAPSKRIRKGGRETSYFEWLDAGLYSPERRGGSMHGRIFYLHEMRYGFEEDRFCIRIDTFAETMSELEDPEFRITVSAPEKLVIVVKLQRGR